MSTLHQKKSGLSVKYQQLQAWMLLDRDEALSFLTRFVHLTMLQRIPKVVSRLHVQYLSGDISHFLIVY